MLGELDRLGRDLRLVNTVHDLAARRVGLKVLTGQGATIDITPPAGKLAFGIFAAPPSRPGCAPWSPQLLLERLRLQLPEDHRRPHALTV